MEPGLIYCSGCQTPWLAEAFNASDFLACGSCGALQRVEVYPAYYRGLEPGAAAEDVLTEGEAACFYHPRKKAMVPCDACGRFLCATCDCDLNGQHLCPACLETGQKKGRLKTLQNHRTLYDNLALALALFPMLIFYFTVVTAPVALYVSIRYWSAPSSLIPRSKVRFILAMVLSSLQILGWIFGIAYLVTRMGA